MFLNTSVCEQRGDDVPPLTPHVRISWLDLGDMELAVGVEDEVVFRRGRVELADLEVGVRQVMVLLADQLQHTTDRHADTFLGEIDASNFETGLLTVCGQFVLGAADGDLKPSSLLAEDELQQGMAVGAPCDLTAKRVVETQLGYRQNVPVTAYYG